MNEDLPVEETVEETPLPLYKQIAEDCAQRIRDGRKTVEGTEFSGFNRAMRRARWERNARRGVVWNVKRRRWVPTEAQAGTKWAGSRKPVEHSLVTTRKARAKAAANADVERGLLEIAKKAPMTNARRLAIYIRDGRPTTPAQERRFRKKGHREAA